MPAITPVDLESLNNLSTLILKGQGYTEADLDQIISHAESIMVGGNTLDIRMNSRPSAGTGKGLLKTLHARGINLQFEGWEELLLHELLGVLQANTAHETDVYAAIEHTKEEFYPRLDRDWCMVLRLGPGTYNLPVVAGRTPKWFTPAGEGTSELVLDTERSVLMTDEQLQQVTSLDLSGIPVVGLDLAGLSGLQSIYLANTGLTDVTPLEALTNLHTVDLTGNGLSATNVGRMIAHLAGKGAGQLKLKGNAIPEATAAAHLASVINQGTLVELEGGLIELEITSGSFTPSLTKPGAEPITWRLPDGNVHTSPGTQSIATGGTVAIFSPDLAGTSALTLQNVSDLGTLDQLTSLESLEIADGSFTDVTPLLGLASLTTVRITGNSAISSAAVDQLVQALDSHGLSNGTLNLAGTAKPDSLAVIDSLASKGWQVFGLLAGSFVVGAGPIDITITTASGQSVALRMPDGQTLTAASGSFVLYTTTAGTIEIECVPGDVIGIELYGDIQDTAGLSDFVNLTAYKIGTVVKERYLVNIPGLIHHWPLTNGDYTDSHGDMDLIVSGDPSTITNSNDGSTFIEGGAELTGGSILNNPDLYINFWLEAFNINEWSSVFRCGNFWCDYGYNHPRITALVDRPGSNRTYEILVNSPNLASNTLYFVEWLYYSTNNELRICVTPADANLTDIPNSSSSADLNDVVLQDSTPLSIGSYMNGKISHFTVCHQLADLSANSSVRNELFNGGIPPQYAALSSKEVFNTTDLYAWFDMEGRHGHTLDKHSGRHLIESREFSIIEGHSQSFPNDISYYLEGDSEDFVFTNESFYFSCRVLVFSSSSTFYYILSCRTSNSFSPNNRYILGYLPTINRFTWIVYSGADATQIRIDSPEVQTNNYYNLECYYDHLNKQIGLALNGSDFQVVDIPQGMSQGSNPAPFFVGKGPFGSLQLFGYIERLTCWVSPPDETRRDVLINNETYAKPYLLPPSLSDLYSWYKLDEANGAAIDAHAGKDLAQFGTVGSLENGRYFNNNSSNYLLGNNAFPDGTFYIALQVRLSLPFTSSFQHIFVNGLLNENDTRCVLGYASGSVNRLSFNIISSDAQYQLINAHLKSNGNVWHFVECFYDASTQEYGIALNKSRFVTATASAGIQEGSFPFILGSRFSQPYFGAIKNLSIWTSLPTDQRRNWLWGGGRGNTYPQ